MTATARTHHRVAIVSDWTEGGAAIACRRLYEALQRETSGDYAWFVCQGMAHRGAVVTSSWPGIGDIVVDRVASRLLARNPSRLARWEGAMEKRRNRVTMLRTVRGFGPRVINVHNLRRYLPFLFVEDLPSDIPLVLTLHDMWALTGYCCYSMGCEKYRDGCPLPCPQAGQWGEASASPDREWSLRRRFFKDNAHRVAVVTPSAWLARLAQETLPRIRVVHIPNSVDTDVFKPVRSRQSARDVLGLPIEGSLVLAGAQHLGEARKGTSMLAEAMEAIHRADTGSVNAVVFGDTGGDDGIPAGWIRAGRIDDERILNLYYNAADVFVLPSLADNLPNTLVEAMACGTPCVAFDVGGCPEIVKEGHTGLLAECGDVPALAGAIQRALAASQDERAGMREACREFAVNEYAMSVQAGRYASLFAEMWQPGEQKGSVT